MKSLKILILSLSTLFSVLNAQEVDSKRLEAAMAILEKTATGNSEYGVRFSVTKVKGETAKEMLKDYAEQSEYEKAIYFMKSEEVPQSEDDSVVGFAKNVDVFYFAVDLYRVDENDKNVLKKLSKEALSALFEATAAGAKVGAESNSWATCGVYFPGLIILNPKTKEMYQLVPNETGC